jgi:hypothetical protein
LFGDGEETSWDGFEDMNVEEKIYLEYEDLNRLRLHACECARKLWQHGAVTQLDLLKSYVDSCLENAKTDKELKGDV